MSGKRRQQRCLVFCVTRICRRT